MKILLLEIKREVSNNPDEIWKVLLNILWDVSAHVDHERKIIQSSFIDNVHHIVD